MFTRCPECQKSQPLTLEQLRSSRGMLRCINCSALFDALTFISETDATVPPESSLENSLPWDRKKKAGPIYWNIGLAFCLLLLGIQFLYFEGSRISQSPGIRTGIEKICRPLGCRLPVYKNSDEFEVAHRSLTLSSDRNYALRIIFSNQAAFRQNYPAINLTLLNFSGEPFAQRILYPKDYHPGASIGGTIAAGAVTEINLKIAAPKTMVGGYDFDFI